MAHNTIAGVNERHPLLGTTSARICENPVSASRLTADLLLRSLSLCLGLVLLVD